MLTKTGIPNTFKIGIKFYILYSSVKRSLKRHIKKWEKRQTLYFVKKKYICGWKMPVKYRITYLNPNP